MKKILQPEQHEDMKEWVLAVSVDKQIEKRLMTDQRGCYEASLVALDGSISQPCIVTGKDIFVDLKLRYYNLYHHQVIRFSAQARRSEHRTKSPTETIGTSC